MFVEKISALMGEVPQQFNPVVYVFAAIAFLWIFDTFAHVFRSLVK